MIACFHISLRILRRNVGEMKDNISATQAWVQGIGRVMVPEVKFSVPLPDGYYPRFLHGSKHTLAVFDTDNQCVGWIEVQEET